MHKLFHLFLILSLSCLFTGHAFANIDDGLVAYYPFDGNANDASGNGNHGLVSGAILTIDRNGNSNSAYEFDGNTARVEASNSSTLDINTSLTYAVWIKTSDSKGVIIGKDEPNSSPRTGCSLTLGISFHCFSSSGEHVYASSKDVNTINYSDNNWHHIVAIYDDNVKVKLYIDGIFIDNSTSSISNIGSNNFSIIIGDRNNPADPVDGTIDDIRIYNRAISESEIQQIYQGNSGGLVAYYPLDGNANDVSGNGNHGSEIGAIGYVDDGHNGSAAYINSFEEYISIDSEIAIRNNFTFSGRYKLSSASTSIWHTFFHTKGGYCLVGGSGLGVMYNQRDSLIRIYDANNCLGIRTIDYQLNTDTWFNFSITYDGSIIKSYIDNTLIDSFSYSSTVSDFSSAIIGATYHPNHQDLTYNWQGSIDDVRIYNRAVSESEIQQLYQGSSVSTGSGGGLVAYYPLDDNANDASGNGNHGAENGGLSYVSGMVDQAADFDGINDYIDHGRSPIHAYLGTN